MSDLMANLEFVCTYLDDVLCISMESFDDHMAKLEKVFKRLLDVGLRCNAPKCTFCATELKYLGYLLTRDGIKSQPKK